jgi:hypothetical protein
MCLVAWNYYSMMCKLSRGTDSRKFANFFKMFLQRFKWPNTAIVWCGDDAVATNREKFAKYSLFVWLMPFNEKIAYARIQTILTIDRENLQKINFDFLAQTEEVEIKRCFWWKVWNDHHPRKFANFGRWPRPWCTSCFHFWALKVHERISFEKPEFANFCGWWSSQTFHQKQRLISTSSVCAKKSKFIFCKFSRPMVRMV